MINNPISNSIDLFPGSHVDPAETKQRTDSEWED